MAPRVFCAAEKGVASPMGSNDRIFGTKLPSLRRVGGVADWGFEDICVFFLSSDENPALGSSIQNCLMMGSKQPSHLCSFYITV